MKNFLLPLLAILFINITQAQVDRRTNSPSDSAQLRISAARSLVIQRMTSAQRSSISSPAEGLQVYQTDNQVGIYEFHSGEWIKLSRGTHYIGELFGGGVVYYITPDALHGLIAETIDQSSSVIWYDAQDVISTSDNHSTAGKNFTDWRLPTKNELNLLFGQKNVVGGFAKGNFAYWSSTESVVSDNACYLNFGIGAHFLASKAAPAHVRAVRSF